MNIDSRDHKLAKMVVEYSVAAKPGDLVMINCVGPDTLGLGAACVEAAAAVGAAPYLVFNDPQIDAAYIQRAGEGSMKRLAEFETVQMKNADCYIGIRGSDNIFETSDIERERMNTYNRLVRQPVHLDIRVNQTRWCVMRYPNPSMAQLAQRSTRDFAEFYYKVCCVDYPKMAEACAPLAALMEKTDKVHITSPGTDLTFSMKDIPVVPCCGNKNVPDGECFTAPVRESITGTVQFNTPTAEGGKAFDNIRLRFENGKAVEAEAADSKQTTLLNEVLDRDEGSRYIGEFAVGFNPGVMEPMRDILFDEKIAGSFHMALGNAYNDADNGNRSALHWDLVCIQRPEYGGGEIYFDNVLIRKDGQFVIDELKGLNPESFNLEG